MNRTNDSGGRDGGKTSGNEWDESFNLSVSPSPFAKQTSIQFTLLETSKVWLSIYLAEVRKVVELLEGEAVNANV